MYFSNKFVVKVFLKVNKGLKFWDGVFIFYIIDVDIKVLCYFWLLIFDYVVFVM